MNENQFIFQKSRYFEEKFDNFYHDVFMKMLFTLFYNTEIVHFCFSKRRNHFLLQPKMFFYKFNFWQASLQSTPSGWGNTTDWQKDSRRWIQIGMMKGDDFGLKKSQNPKKIWNELFNFDRKSQFGLVNMSTYKKSL